MSVEFVDPTEWWLDLPPPAQFAEQPHATSDRRWNAYLNQVCLDRILSWIRSEYAAQAVGWLGRNHNSAVWDVVNGTAIVLNPTQPGATRLVLIPSEAIDDAELEVPQEWVDIPSWAGDYYLAMQVNLTSSDTPYLRVWGYTTHQALKATGEYDANDRTYCLSREALNRDLSTFGVTLQFCTSAQTRAAIAPLPELAPAQAEQLMQRLGTPSVRFPRLAVPFSLWGALLERQEWRQRLYQQRSSTADLAGATVNLGQWLQNRFTQHHFAAGWQSVSALLGSDAQLAMSLRSAESDAEVTQVKRIELISHSVLLLVKLRAEAEERVGVVAQVYPTLGSASVPAALTLALLTETGEVLQSVQAGEQDDYTQLRRFRCAMTTRFSLQISWQTHRVTENFVL